MRADTAADIALLERMFEEWERGEYWNAEPYADDVVFVRSGPDGGEYRGLVDLGRAWRDFLGAWADMKIKGERIVPGPRGVYVLMLQLQGRGHGSGMAIEADVANVVQMEDNQVKRLEMYWDRGAALAAAGVP
jgi:ketosteroid isomerase-like protein